MKSVFARVALAAALSLGSLSAQTGNVTVLHGIPGLPAAVEVFANGGRLFSFEYGEQRGPLALAPGAYALDVQLQGTSVLTGNLTLNAGDDVSVIAHLDAAGANTLTVFTNDVSSLSLPESRLTVRHTAQAPVVDVLVEQNGSQVALFPGLANGNEVSAPVPPGSYDASLLAGGGTAFGPASVALENGYSYIVYAVGDVSAPNFQLLIQRIDLAARVTVVHGIPGLPAPVDVTANGAQLFSFDFTDVRGPLVLNPGTYAINVDLQGTTVLSTSPTVGAGDDVTIVAHLDAAGANVLTAFGNDVSPIVARPGIRLALHHTAQAPAVDIELADFANNPLTTVTSVSNGQQFVSEFGAAVYNASVVAGGQTVLGPLTLKTFAETSYSVFVLGQAPNALTAVVVERDLAPAVPGGLSTTVSGTSCGPTMGSSAASFAFGESFAVTIANGGANALAILNLGDSNTAFGAVALPASLTAAGAPGCFLNANFLASHPVTLDANGDGSFELSVPSAVSGSLPNLYFQWLTPTTSNALGFLSSEALELSAN